MKRPCIWGAIAGDIIGSTYEFHPTHDYDFQLLPAHSTFTDDSVMTIAVADWLLNFPDLNKGALVAIMQKWGHRYPYIGYGGMFAKWLRNENPLPYNSWGNGSAMRVSPVGFAFESLKDTLLAAEISASVTHNHPEGIKGAQATAAAIFLARTGKSKAEIRDYIESTFGYDMHRTWEQLLAAHYKFDCSCRGSVPESLITFLDSSGFEDAIRSAISLGGDADTMAAIAGSVAGAYYDDIPDQIAHAVATLLPEDLSEVVDRFCKRFS